MDGGACRGLLVVLITPFNGHIETHQIKFEVNICGQFHPSPVPGYLASSMARSRHCGHLASALSHCSRQGAWYSRGLVFLHRQLRNFTVRSPAAKASRQMRHGSSGSFSGSLDGRKRMAAIARRAAAAFDAPFDGPPGPFAPGLSPRRSSSAERASYVSSSSSRNRSIPLLVRPPLPPSNAWESPSIGSARL